MRNPWQRAPKPRRVILASLMPARAANEFARKIGDSVVARVLQSPIWGCLLLGNLPEMVFFLWFPLKTTTKQIPQKSQTYISSLLCDGTPIILAAWSLANRQIASRRCCQQRWKASYCQRLNLCCNSSWHIMTYTACVGLRMCFFVLESRELVVTESTLYLRNPGNHTLTHYALTFCDLLISAIGG